MRQFSHLLMVLIAAAWFVGCSGGEESTVAPPPKSDLGAGSSDPSAMMNDTDETSAAETAAPETAAPDATKTPDGNPFAAPGVSTPPETEEEVNP